MISPRVVGLVPAAGLGLRLSAGAPKAFVSVAGESLLCRSVRGLLSDDRVIRAVVAVSADERDRARDELAAVNPRVDIVAGGAQRSDSVRAALDAATDADVVLVHDAARCLTPPSMISSVIDAVLAGHPAVLPVLAVPDTVKRVDEHGAVTATVDRETLRLAQTPQGFAAELLRRAYAAAGSVATDDAGLVERIGHPVHTVAGHPHAFKITTPFDLAVARALLAEAGR